MSADGPGIGVGIGVGIGEFDEKSSREVLSSGEAGWESLAVLGCEPLYPEPNEIDRCSRKLERLAEPKCKSASARTDILQDRIAMSQILFGTVLTANIELISLISSLANTFT